MRRQVSLVAAILVMTGLAEVQAQRPGFPTTPASPAIPHDEGVVQGRIVDDRSGQPIAGAVV